MNEKTISRRSLLKLASASTVTAAAVLPSAARAAQADQWDETYEIIVVGGRRSRHGRRCQGCTKRRQARCGA